MLTQRFVPHAYQLQAMQHLAEHPAAGLLLQPGLGKTVITLSVLKALKLRKIGGRTLVIAPRRVCYEVWPKEIVKWDVAAGLSLAIAHGPKKDAALRSGADIVVINPEGLPWLAAEFHRNKALAAQFSNLVVDESTKFKNSQSQRFKILRELLPMFGRRHILTGTPAPRGLEDLFGQIFILDAGERLGRYVTHFRRAYFTEHRNAWQAFSEWVPALDAEERIMDKISDICLSMKAIDHLQMPPLVINDITVEMNSAVVTVYRQMERDFAAELASGAVTAMNAAVKTGKLRQIASGNLYTNDSGDYEVLHHEKLLALSDLVDECAGQPLLVGVAYTSEAQEIQKAFEGTFGAVPYLGAGISDKEVARVLDLWNTGKLPLLLAHPASVAHGLNLQAGGNQLCWYSLTWSQEEYEQFINRVYRQGQKSTVVVHRLLAAHDGEPVSIEQAIVERLAARDKLQSSVMDSLKRHFK